VRTSDPLNPIHRTQHHVSDCYGWHSADENKTYRANLGADVAPRWPLFVIVACGAALLGLLALHAYSALGQAVVAHLPH
jgi:hypothetical protein